MQEKQTNSSVESMAIPWPPFITRVINPHRELDSLDNVSQRVINEIITPILCELLTAMKERGGTRGR